MIGLRVMVLSLGIGLAFGAPAQAQKRVNKPGNFLDFEADVIEGEKRRPDLFIQMEGGSESLDSVLYSREDFNDYHEQDRKWRPKARRFKGDKK
ncbi:MAG: hypothetical protein ACK5QT_10875 [Oligoflexia bacterium]|jgi:hypothetical protein